MRHPFLLIFLFAAKHQLLLSSTISTTPFIAETQRKEWAREEFYRKVQNVPIEDAYATDLYQRWVEQAFSSLFAVIANEKLKKDFNDQRGVHTEFGACSGSAESALSHAKCLSKLLGGKMTGKQFELKKGAARFDKYRMEKKAAMAREMTKNPMKMAKNRHSVSKLKKKIIFDNQHNIGAFRILDSPTNVSSSTTVGPMASMMGTAASQNTTFESNLTEIYSAHRRLRRQTGIIKKGEYSLITTDAGRPSVFGQIAKILMEQVLKKKGKTADNVVPWQKTVERIQKLELKRKEEKKRLEEGEIESLDQMAYRGLRKRNKGVPLMEDLRDLMDKPEELARYLAAERRRKSEGKGGQIKTEKLVRMIRDAILLGFMATGQNVTREMRENALLKALSPRFLSVTPDSERNETTLDFISPSLFSLHSEGKGIENLTSIPNLFKTAGSLTDFNSRDQQAWMDLIMEASGANERVENGTLMLTEDKLKENLINSENIEKYKKELKRKEDGTPLYFTKQNVSDAFGETDSKTIDIFERMQKSINKYQIKAMNETGFAILTRQQLNMLYGPNSTYQDEKLLERIKSLNKSQLLAHIERDIHAMAELKSFKVVRKMPLPSDAGGFRRKRAIITLSPILFTPFVLQFLTNSVVLSPILFSPLILSPAVFGAVILSPWLFVPVVLSPRILSPVVLSPFVLDPIILTPIALVPVILSPAVMAPFVLSPFLLDPFVLSPAVLTPLILSPLALSPAILSPKAGSPLVLSPYVLSPVLYSPQFLGALVLSPYALSPVVASPLAAFAVILSPSWLS